MRLADLAAADRESFRHLGARDGDAVQLRCDLCHQNAPDGSGMRPILYDRDCRSCHSLAFEPGLPPMRHGLQPPEVSTALWRTYSGLYQKGAGDRESAGAARPVPGGEGTTGVVDARETIGRKVARAERVLYGEKKCGECHAIEAPDGRVLPPDVPSAWFRKATFDHASHRLTECRSCHAQAYPDAPDASRSSADVMLPGVAVCQSCHAPRASNAGGASYTCVECHRYHPADPSRAPAKLARKRDPGRAGPMGYTREGVELVASLRSWISSRPIDLSARRH
jgi:hypothetical protein